MEADLLEAQEKVAALIAEGDLAFGEGRIEEALAISGAALESHPSNSDALVLRSLCFERLGNISEALECAEKVVELNPDSELDKIRRNGLRTALGNTLIVPKRSDRRSSLILSIAATLMILSVAGAALHYSNQNQRVAKTTTPTVEQPTAFGPGAFSSQPAQTPVAQNSSPAPTPQDTGDQSESKPPFDPAPRSSGVLPVSPPDVGVIPEGQPLTPSLNRAAGASPPAASTNGDPAPVPEGAPTSNSSTTPPASTDPVAEDPGTIQITVHHGPVRGINQGAQPIGGNDSGGLTRNGVEALSRTGDQQFIIGSYSAAANSFEKALRGGGNPIRLNQRLGDAYKELGRNSEAISAYARAISACQDALQSGKGDTTSIQAALKSCQLNVKVLGG